MPVLSLPHRFVSQFMMPSSNSEQATRRHIYWWLFIRVSSLTLMIIITALLVGKNNKILLPPFSESAFFLLIIYSFSIVSVIILRKLPLFSVRLFSMVQLLIDVLLICLLIYTTGCIQSIFTPILILPIVVGGLILYRKEALILAAVATLGYGGILTLELLGILPSYYLTSNIYRPTTNSLSAANLFAIYGLLFFLSALFSGQLALRLRATEEALTRTVLKYDSLVLLYKQIFDDISTGIVTVDHQDFITSYNQAAERITGYPREKVLGRSFDRCFPDIFIHGMEIGRQVCDFKKYNQSGVIRLGYVCSLLNMPSPDADGEEAEPARWKVISMQDISQIERIEQQMREKEKMAAIGEISASIAHDLRNPLAAISGSVQILNMESKASKPIDPDSYATLIDIILRESDRMTKTLNNFSQFARPAQLVFERLELGALISKLISELRNGKHHQSAQKIKFHLSGTHCFCWVDRQQIHTALLQILENACQAMEGREGEIFISVREIVTPQRSVFIEICDQGPGIPVELRDKVFTPFFSNRTDGSGLGLAIARQIIENHRGTVSIEQNANYACIIRIHLPHSQTKASPSLS